MSKIKVLEEIEHIRKRPGMYIGEAITPEHLVTEVIDNALDELVNGYTKKIELNIDDKNQIIEVIDWGRGIPIHPVKMPDGSTQDSVVAIATKLFSSAKFDREAYDISIGQNGVGLVVVNALSKYMVITTKHKRKHRRYYFEQGSFIKYEDIPRQDYSTKVEFSPDMSYFQKWFDKEKFLDRLRLVKVHYPKATIIFNGTEVEDIGYETFVRQVLGISEDTPLFKVEGKDGVSKLEIYFTYDLSDKAKLPPIIVGDVNLKIADGTYISTMQSTIANVVDQVKPKSYVMTKQDSLVRFRAYISVLVPEPRFDSQNKTRFVGDIRPLFKRVIPQLVNLYKKESYLKQALEKINEYRILKELGKNNKSAKKKKLSVGNPIKESKKPGTLYIVEGLSAAGTLTQIRNVNTEAVFPLKGKIINVESNTLDKVLNNKEVKFLLESLGIEYGKSVTITRDSVAILADGDADGYHISVLVILMLLKFAKPYFEQGKVYLIVPPLYAYRKNGKLVLHKSMEPPPVDNYIRYKGLGEMNPEELELVIRDKDFWIQLDIPDNEKEIIKVITDSEYKRHLLQEQLPSLYEYIAKN